MNILLPKQKQVNDRRSLILKEIRNSAILHIGCTDSPFTKQRLFKNELLHQQMLREAIKVVGIDINQVDINLMRDYGIKDLYVLDIYELRKLQDLKLKFDYIVLSEVLEHLPNAAEALIQIKEFIKLNNSKAKLIITVPNKSSYLFDIVNFIRNVEQVHPDHVAYYSYKTLKNILEYSGFRIEKFMYATYGLKKAYKPLAILLNLVSSSFMPGLFVVASEINDNR